MVLVILDGFGVSLDAAGNPAAEAKKPILSELERQFPLTTLQASGVAVGLPWGEAGNSEVGHLTMGAGRVIHHHLPRIIHSIRDGSFFENPALRQAADHVRQHQSRLHIAGLVSSGSVHSYAEHLWALLEFAKRAEIPEVYLHIFTDGKDAPPKEGANFLAGVEERMRTEYPQARMASVIGRFFAMDRDEKWERVRRAYELLTQGKGERISSIPQYLEASYSRGITDDSIEQAMVLEVGGCLPAKALAQAGELEVGGHGDKDKDKSPTIRENDAVIFLNFREDSMRELTRAFVEDDFDKFPRQIVSNLLMVTMTEYDKNIGGVRPAFPALEIVKPLGRVVSDAGLRQLRIAETEKYAHVTYFFNGGDERPFSGEDRILIPSVMTLHVDETPQMRVHEITEKVIENVGEYDVIIANFANADMVGHSGNFQAAVEAVEALDGALGVLSGAILKTGGVMLITADHGNIELKRDRISGEKLTEHSLNPVPFILVGNGFRRKTPRSDEEVIASKKEVGGILTDVAPTILELLGLEKPVEMTGQSLLSVLAIGV